MKNAEKLIEAVRARPHLYDQTLQNSKHVSVKGREQDWTEVAQIVYGRQDQATVNKVKIRWKSLRDAFVKRQRKRESSKYHSRPYLYEAEMQWLKPYIHRREREDIDLGIHSHLDIKTEDHLNSNASMSDSTADGDLQEKAPILRAFIWGQRRQDGSGLTEAEKQEGVGDKSDMADPVDAFFHGIAQTVKQLRPPTVARLKKTIANIVLDAEIEELDKK